MSFKDIIVYVDGTEASKARDVFAISLAKTYGAHLVAVAFAPQALLPLYGADVAFADMSGVLDGVKAQGEEALARFRKCALEAQVSFEEQLMQGTSDEFLHQGRGAADRSWCSRPPRDAIRWLGNTRWSSAACSRRGALC